MKGKCIRLFLFIIIFTLMTQPAFAVMGVCESAKIPECKHDVSDPDRASQTRSFCEMLKANDKACTVQVPLAAGYTAVALVCTAVCVSAIFTLGIGESADTICQGGSLLVGLADVGASIALTQDDYAQKASSMVAEDWQIGVAGASASGNAVILGLEMGAKQAASYAASNAADKAAASARHAESLKGVADAKQAAATTAQNNANASGEGILLNSQGEQIGNNPLQKSADVAQKGADQAANDATKAGANAANDKAQAADTAKTSAKESDEANTAAACVSAALNIVMASVKWYDYSAIEHSSALNQRRVQDLQGNGLSQFKAKPQQNELGKAAESEVPNQDDSRSVASKNLETTVNDANKKGEIANAISSGFNRNFLGNQDPQAIQKSLDNFMNKTGLTPGSLADSASKNGVASTIANVLSTAVDNPDELKKKLANMDMAAKDWIAQYGKGLDGSFGSSLAGGSKGKKSGASPFGDLSGLLGGRKPGADKGAGISDPKFGGFGTDIWHAGTTKSIFEIVSDRTQRVSDRVKSK